MRRLLLLLALSGPTGFQQALLTLTGASCVEELSEDEVQHYQSLAAHPVDLNLAGRSRLLSTGLLTPFQVASLLDYRTRTGAVLSWAELALVDGFNARFVEALREFAFLGVPEGEAPGKREDRRLRQSLTLRGALRPSEAAAWGAKYEAALGERAAFFASVRTTLSDPKPGFPTLSAAYYGRGVLGQLVVGHFNARFGQGLVQWSGFQLSGYSSLGALRKNGTGFSPTGSYGADLLGLAADWHFGPWRLSTAYSWTGQRPILNLERSWRTVTAGLTATDEAASLEARVSLPGWSLFGEVAYAWRRGVSALAGAYLVPSYGHRWGCLLRWYGPADKRYSGLAAGYEAPSFSATLDAGWRTDTGAQQYKSVVQWQPALAWRGIGFRPALRLAGRFRPDETVPLRLELRATLGAEYGPWLLGGRYDLVRGCGWAWHWYAEAARRQPEWSAYLRGGLFKVDDWDDRIYVYERDAPGSFSVPARYGRGWSASLYLAWQPVRRHSLWLRLETVQYPWNLTPRDGRFECRLQYRFKM
ncbi:hypothetical protein SAMN06298214_0843 [Bacteroidales bacterium WCE2004]|nr:hypothetical protein SAMN06298214_0843 [Bacteroidales bacterium WCE2004]